MTKKLYSYELIEAVCNAFGPSGCEDAVAVLICGQIDDLGAEIKRDRLGNVICRFVTDDGKADRKKLMISAHMDEVGFMVSEITDKGYLKFGNVGGIMSAVLSGRHVSVGDEKAQVGGVIASKPIHLKSAEDRLKPEKEENLYIDIGVDSEDEARKYADVGTFATFAANFGRFGKDGRMLRSKALDDRLTILHIHDNNGDGDFHLAPFTQRTFKENYTSTDWDAFIKGLKEIGYTGPLSFETFNALVLSPKPLHEPMLRFIAETGKYFKEQIEN